MTKPARAMRIEPDDDTIARWTRERIYEEIVSVKKELDRASDSSTSRLDESVRKIAALESNTGEVARLRRYIYCVSALVHHGRSGGLSAPQVRRIAKLAEGLLTSLGIRPNSSKREFLFGDIHLALSEIHRQDGEHWRAAWEQQLGLYLSARYPSGGQGFQALVLAVRALRLGHAKLALQKLEEAEREGLTGPALERARLEQLKILRLTCRHEDAELLARETLALTRLSEEGRREIEWEQASREASRDGNLDPLIGRVLKGKSHHEYGYILEAFLWTRALKARDWLARFPSARSIARNQKLDPREEGYFYECAQTLELAFDASIPLERRIKALGECLFRARELKTIDQELLLWAAATRTLFRLRAQELGALALSEYTSLCLGLTGGKTKDILGVLGDLYDET